MRVVEWEQVLGFLEVALASALRESVVSERMRPKTLRLWEPLVLLPEQLVRVSSQQEREVPETGLNLGVGADATSTPVFPANFTKIGLETKWSVGETVALIR